MRTPLRIAVLAHVRHPIRAPFAGGLEAHTWHLARGLAERGHAVTLFASGDSDAGVELDATVGEHYERRLPWTHHRDGEVLRRHLHDAFERAWRRLRTRRFDVVHNNTVHPLPIERARRDGQPMLTTLHVPPFGALRRAVDGRASPALRYAVTSRRQRGIWWADGAPAEAHVVHNGLDLRDWPFGARGDGSAVWAGRIAPTKGTDLAIRAARRAGVPLSIVGPVDDRAYFEQRVRPLLGGDVRHLGHLDGEALAAVFRTASVLLFTPLWEEPFGLVAAEAMASGLPVACTDRGAVREVVGEAGAYAEREDADALGEAIARALEIPRTVARSRVEARFTIAGMLDGYERLYEACMAGAVSSHPGGPHEPAPAVPDRIAS